MIVEVIKKSSVPTSSDSENYLECLWLDTAPVNPILKYYKDSVSKWVSVASASLVELAHGTKMDIQVLTKSEFELLDVLSDTTIYLVKGIGIFIGSYPLNKSDNIVYVNPNYTGNRVLGCSWDFPYNDLQVAINQAQPGDTLWLMKGDYKSDGYMGTSFFIDKQLTIIGGFKGDETTVYDREDISGTVLTGESIRKILKITTNNVILDSLTFWNGYTDTTNGAAVESEGNTIIKRCKFINNIAVLGGAVYNAYQIYDSCFEHNRGMSNGNSIYFDKAGKVEGCTFIGGINNSCVYSTSKLEFYNNVIWNKSIGGDSIVYDINTSIIKNCASTSELNGVDCILISRTNAGEDPGIFYARFKSPGENNYELSDDSDLIGKGDTAEVVLTTDLAGKPRVCGLTVDIGAYENQNTNTRITVDDIEGLDKEAIGLGNVDNTSDLDKPISNAARQEFNTILGELDQKADLQNGQIAFSQIPSAFLGDLKFAGVWDAFDNIPHLINGDMSQTKTYYVATTEGIQFGYHFNPGDYCLNDSGVWKQVQHKGASVTSINGKTGAIVLTISDIAGLREDLESKANKDTVNQELAGKADLIDGKVPDSQLPSYVIGTSKYLGPWDAEHNTPVISNNTPEFSENYYRVAKAGTWNNITFLADDFVINLLGTWYRVPGENALTEGKVRIDTFAPGQTVYQVGSRNTVTLTWTFAGLPEGVDPDYQAIDGVTVANNYRSFDVANVTDSKIFTLTAVWNGVEMSAQTKVVFLHEIYYGISTNDSLDSAGIVALNKVWCNGTSITGKFTPGEGGEYFYLAVPMEYADSYMPFLNGFMIVNAVNKEPMDITNESSYSHSFLVMRSINKFNGTLYYNIDASQFAEGESGSGAGKTFRYMGSWDAFANKPQLSNGDVTQSGMLYVVAIGGTRFGVTFYPDDCVWNAGGNWIRLEGGFTNI